MKTLIYVFAFSSPRAIRARVNIARAGRDKQYRFHGRGCECTYGRPKSASARSTERKWVIRVFARTSTGPELPIPSPYCSVQLIMPIDRVGIGPARPCMLMCERTSVSPPRVLASSTQTQPRNTRARYVCTCYLQPRFAPRREIYACENVHVRDKCRAIVNVRMHLKEVLPDVRFFSNPRLLPFRRS